MKRLKMFKQKITACMIITILCICPISVSAAPSDDIQTEIDSYQEELDGANADVEETSNRIQNLEKKIGELTSEIESRNIEANDYREAMSKRIKYFYESGGSGISVFDIICHSANISDMLNRIMFLQDIYAYDNDQLQEYANLIDNNKEEIELLSESESELEELLSQQEDQVRDLEDTISDKEQELQEAKDQEEKEEAERKATEEAQNTQSDNKNNDSGSGSSSDRDESTDNIIVDPNATGSGRNWTSSDGRFVVVNGVAQESGKTSGGKMTKTKGVVYFNGHKETYYSQKILPGNGLWLPGRHVNSQGLVCDGDGYICLASSDYPHDGTVAVLTSLGWGKVYDCGCASGTIDLYVDW